jgi:hypothetical protein
MFKLSQTTFLHLLQLEQTVLAVLQLRLKTRMSKLFQTTFLLLLQLEQSLFAIRISKPHFSSSYDSSRPLASTKSSREPGRPGPHIDFYHNSIPITAAEETSTNRDRARIAGTILGRWLPSSRDGYRSFSTQDHSASYTISDAQI